MMNKEQGFRISLLMDTSTACLFAPTLYGMSSFPFCSGPPVHRVKHFKDQRSEYVLEEIYGVEHQLQKLGCLILLLDTSELHEGATESSQGEMCFH